MILVKYIFKFLITGLSSVLALSSMSLFAVIGISLRFENACKHEYIVVAVMGVPTYIYKSSFIFLRQKQVGLARDVGK